MNRIAALTSAERQPILQEAAQRLGLSPVIVEKDFWVCWLLGLLFGTPTLAGTLVFKGGTSLSKVFHAIRRFSEDIDLSVNPVALGITDAESMTESSRRQRDAFMEKLESRCAAWTQKVLQVELEQEIVRVLGLREEGKAWLHFETDPLSQSPVLWFQYPSSSQSEEAYIRRQVKLELGSLTDQLPTGRYRIQPWLAQILPAPLSGMGCEVVALELARTFWEKATILHAEFHRDPATPMPDRYSRHYADLAALARMQDPWVDAAIRDHALRQRVVDWKMMFFARSWAYYDKARPGTFRLVPPGHRLAELERDYREMNVMFLDEPVSFQEIIKTLQDLEMRINGSL